jgi:hypothetical protein
MTHSMNSNHNKNDLKNTSFGSQCIHYFFLSNLKLILNLINISLKNQMNSP